MQKEIEEEAESGYIIKRDEGYGRNKRRNINEPITDGRSLGIDIPSHVSTGGGRSVPSPLPSTAAANSSAKTFVGDPPIGNTDNNNYSESVQASFLNANFE
eukprot:scaffold4735_cov104-Alexandrium_tamarense.AAC.3